MRQGFHSLLILYRERISYNLIHALRLSNPETNAGCREGFGDGPKGIFLSSNEVLESIYRGVPLLIMTSANLFTPRISTP